MSGFKRPRLKYSNYSQGGLDSAQNLLPFLFLQDSPVFSAWEFNLDTFGLFNCTSAAKGYFGRSRCRLVRDMDLI